MGAPNFKHVNTSKYYVFGTESIADSIGIELNEDVESEEE